MRIAARRMRPAADPVIVEFERVVAEGGSAPRGTPCPYGKTDLFRRCAWLAGYYDSRRSV